MKRCKARSTDNWRCVRPVHDGDDHGYSPVKKIRLPKSQMALLHSLRASVTRVEQELCEETRANFLLTALKARDELLEAIDGLEVWGIKLAEEHAAQVHGELHRGHKVCFYTTEESCLGKIPPVTAAVTPKKSRQARRAEERAGR